MVFSKKACGRIIIFLAVIFNQQAKAQTVTTLAGSTTSGSSNGVGISASFNAPIGIAIDGNGNLFVNDYLNQLIRQIVVSTGSVSTLAGNAAGGSSNGVGINASFYYATGIAADGTNVYVMDNANNMVRQIVVNTAVVSTLAGSKTHGNNDGTGTSAGFYAPAAAVTDGNGNLYIADSHNNEIRKIVIASGVVTTVAGNYTGSVVGANKDGIGAAASFWNPTGITTDGNGNLYVADYGNNEIRKIAIATNEVTTLAGSSTAGSIDAVGTAAKFSSLYGITYDGYGNLYVINNNKIRKIVIATAVVTTVAGSNTAGSNDGVGTAASFKSPSGITSDGNGNLYVADNGNNEIRKISGILLPIELLGFSGTLQNKNALLNWEMSQIEEGVTYDLQRSLDSRNFLTINSQIGNSSKKQFNYNDALLANGTTYYYRLKMTGKDGQYTYSNMAIINVGGSSVDIMIYPNPISKNKSLQLNLQNIIAEKIEIINALGQIVYMKEGKINGSLGISIPSSFKSGDYIVRIIGNGNVITKKILVQ